MLSRTTRHIALGCATLALAWSASAGCQRDADKDAAARQQSDMVLPGAEPFPVALAQSLRAALAARDDVHEIRTHHRNPDGSPRFSNRLLLESSPYLRQHAHNPVNWYAWGEEAFAAARRLGRPILLSIGYSTCHWCHVMEEESFEDLEIATYMNAHYVAIKVDREELPDVDSVYMAAVLRQKGSGGWPMTVWLTPDLSPFHADSYIPPRVGVRGARLGFIDLLQRFSQEYQTSPDTVVARGQALARDVELMMRAPPIGGALERERAEQLLMSAAAQYKARFDARHGGVRGGPKFPSAMPVRLLLRLHRRTRDPELLTMATTTLDAMAAGGIHDQVGGGFHRYTVDQGWLVPHFEKMLYDNALLAMAYLEGFQATGRAEYAGVARDTLDYLIREMSAPEGGFYSATDADSVAENGHLEEGAFFVWTQAQLRQALDDASYDLARALFGITERGNFEGANILARTRPLGQVATELGLDLEQAEVRLAALERTLYQVRRERVPPRRDDKVLVAWNGLAISALARAARVLESDAPARSAYLERARKAADFILEHMRDGDGLWRSALGKRAHVPAYLDDYALFIGALLDLFEADANDRYLSEAMKLDAVVERRFEDQERGGFFLSSADHDALFVREKPSYDGATPSGTSAAVIYLLKLHALTGDARYLERAERAMASVRATLERSPLALADLLIAMDFWTDSAKEIVIVAPESADQAAPFTRVLGHSYTPNAVTCVVAGRDVQRLGQRAAVLRDKIAQRGETTAYVCRGQRCELPTRDPAVFARQLEAYEPLP